MLLLLHDSKMYTQQIVHSTKQRGWTVYYTKNLVGATIEVNILLNAFY